MSAEPVIPVVLFAHARPAHLGRTLECLRANHVPRLIAYADGARATSEAAAVDEVRRLLRRVDWCEVQVIERTANLGLGPSVLTGVTEVAAEHEAFLVLEDDLVCVPGTYAWMAAALRRYRDVPNVFSVTGWTHARVAPAGLGGRPYFDARAESWSWGAYARSWCGMNEQTAREKMVAARVRGVAPDACGADLPAMAEAEISRRLWAVRWIYHHLAHGGLCLRPPVSLVNHAGFDPAATNAGLDDEWHNAELGAPPADWPEPVEHPDVRARWRAAYAPSWPRRWRRLWQRVRGRLRR